KSENLKINSPASSFHPHILESTEDQGYDIKKLYELRVFCAIVQYDLAATALTASFWFKSWTL
ncbi:8500_t:CDS:1, partial [Entrophospora sp. SA101]